METTGRSRDSSFGYYRHPTLRGDALAFVCEADLWAVSSAGGAARRLTAHRVEGASPLLSPDGEWLAFAGREEGALEIWSMPAAGGPARRLTFQAAPICYPVGWDPRDGRMLYASTAERPLGVRAPRLWAIPPGGGVPELLPWGSADRIAFGPERGLLLGRRIADPARWKRYRGGTAGELWIDPDWTGGAGHFRLLLRVDGNIASPLWVGERIWFLSDHEGWGNLYSCTPRGEELERHTDHQGFYARNATSDGERIAYQRAGDLHVFDPATGEDRKLEVRVDSGRAPQARRWVTAADYVEDAALHPRGHSLALTARGKSFTLGAWEGPVQQHGERHGVRQRLTRWLADGERVVAVSDAGGEEALEVHRADGTEPGVRLDGLAIGRPLDLAVAPGGERLALSNHRYEVVVVDLEARAARVVDRSAHGAIRGLGWSPDGRWLAYGFADSEDTTHLRAVDVAGDAAPRPLTATVHADAFPSFDPDGERLYFLGCRTFNPVYDQVHFDLGFPRGWRPYALLLRRDVRDPFDPEPRPLTPPEPDRPAPEEAPPAVEIDFEGIEGRVLAFPVEEGLYGRVHAARGGRVFFDRHPVKGALDADPLSVEPPKPEGSLQVFDFATQREETFQKEVSGFSVSADGSALLVGAGKKLRVVRPDATPPDDAKPGRSSGWVDLGRVRLLVEPTGEWRQMFREAWRLQRDHFWDPGMSGIDWQEIHDRWLPVLDRIATREELSDLLWEVQGELGTSHAYEYGGDRPEPPPFRQGLLGADLVPDDGGWRIAHLVRGDSWDRDVRSPLAAPGLDVREGDLLVAVDGEALTSGRHPNERLAHHADVDVTLTLLRPGEEAPRRVTVRPLRDDSRARYRDWVEANRRKVLDASGGRVGYVHIPDMMGAGYAEFHRYWLLDQARDGLIVDVRFNRGGHVSELLLEKLARRPLGWGPSRHAEPVTYPSYARRGPTVGLTNEHAGSDGDMFSHAFKLLGLGPLIGKRTWGGVIGISADRLLADRTLVTQAEYATWFNDVGWGVENYGTDPDIEVEVTPQDYAAGRDPQLERAIAEVLELIEQKPPERPSFAPAPNLRPKALPRDGRNP